MDVRRNSVFDGEVELPVSWWKRGGGASMDLGEEGPTLGLNRRRSNLDEERHADGGNRRED